MRVLIAAVIVEKMGYRKEFSEFCMQHIVVASLFRYAGKSDDQTRFRELFNVLYVGEAPLFPQLDQKHKQILINEVVKHFDSQ
jgi:hypothetical protein